MPDIDGDAAGGAYDIAIDLPKDSGGDEPQHPLPDRLQLVHQNPEAVRPMTGVAPLSPSGRGLRRDGAQFDASGTEAFLQRPSESVVTRDDSNLTAGNQTPVMGKQPAVESRRRADFRFQPELTRTLHKVSLDSRKTLKRPDVRLRVRLVEQGRGTEGAGTADQVAVSERRPERGDHVWRGVDERIRGTEVQLRDETGAILGQRRILAQIKRKEVSLAIAEANEGGGPGVFNRRVYPIRNLIPRDRLIRQILAERSHACGPRVRGVESLRELLELGQDRVFDRPLRPI